MRDSDVRTALHRQLAHEHAKDAADTLVLDELGLCNEVRVDIAVINGALSGYELKSARDTLTRLPSQVKTYSRVLDHAVLVVAENHLKAARRELRPWWGIEVARVVNGDVILEHARQAKLNPRIDKASVAQLLWRGEALEILATRGLDRGVRSATRDVIWARVAVELELDELRDEVRRALKARRGWRDGQARGARGATSQREGTLPRFLARRLR